MKDQEIYVFIDNTFMFTEGYKHVNKNIPIGPTKKPQFNYLKFRRYAEKTGLVKRIVLVGSNLAGSLISNCQRNGFEVITLPKYPDFRTGVLKEKGVDQKIGWEIAKTIFLNKDAFQNKKIILCTGDKDFASILSDIHTSGWAFELWFWKDCYSASYVKQVEVFGKIHPLDAEWKDFIDIVDI